MEQYEKYREYKKAMWLIVVALFFLISFMTGAWRFSWLIFLVGAAVGQLLKAVLLQDDDYAQPEMRLEERRRAWTSALWLTVVILYFVISFATGAWYVTWVIFLIGAAVNPIVRVNIK